MKPSKRSVPNAKTCRVYSALLYLYPLIYSMISDVCIPFFLSTTRGLSRLDSAGISIPEKWIFPRNVSTNLWSSRSKIDGGGNDRVYISSNDSGASATPSQVPHQHGRPDYRLNSSPLHRYVDKFDIYFSFFLLTLNGNRLHYASIGLRRLRELLGQRIRARSTQGWLQVTNV